MQTGALPFTDASACAPRSAPPKLRRVVYMHATVNVMSDSSQIPNLKTLLGRGRGGGLRGRARGGPGASSESLETVRDNAVRGTDQDAAGSRVSCVELGYLDDPYARFFASQPSTRRLPLLNRGTIYPKTSINLFSLQSRNLRPHLRNRPPHRPLPHHPDQNPETNRLPRRRHRHTLLPPKR